MFNCMYALFLRPLLFLLDPETTHYATMALVSRMLKFQTLRHYCRRYFGPKRDPVTVAGICFKNRLGLAAGFDKNARWIEVLSCFGFGHIEIGTVTPLPQPGNDRPRLFRLPRDRAIINRMGFNGEGVDAVVKRLKKLDREALDVVIGGNIGKNKATPNEKAVNDYLVCFEKLFDFVDYFTINVSSPNTPGLRELQDREPLEKLLKAIMERNRAKNAPKPVFLKIAPDMTEGQLEDVAAIVTETGVSGIIATNTTVSREILTTSPQELERVGAGGLSGAPLRARSTAVLRTLAQKTQRAIPLIGAGGVFTPEDAKEKLDAGASLVQVYTGFIYEGPSIVRNILHGLT